MITDLIISATHTNLFRALFPEFGTDMDYTMLETAVDNAAYTTYELLKVVVDPTQADLIINILF